MPVGWTWSDGTAVVLGVLLCVLTLAPITLPRGEDNFPFSRYPMFTGKRPPRETVVFVEARLSSGKTVPVGAHVWSDGGGFNQARTYVTKLSRRHDGSIETLCTEIAASVPASGEAWAGDATTIRIVRGIFQLKQWFLADEPAPVKRAILATCPVQP